MRGRLTRAGWPRNRHNHGIAAHAAASIRRPHAESGSRADVILQTSSSRASKRRRPCQRPNSPRCPRLLRPWRYRGAHQRNGDAGVVRRRPRRISAFAHDCDRAPSGTGSPRFPRRARESGRPAGVLRQIQSRWASGSRRWLIPTAIQSRSASRPDACRRLFSIRPGKETSAGCGRSATGIEGRRGLATARRSQVGWWSRRGAGAGGYWGSVRGSPKWARRLRSPNQVMAEM